MRPRCVLLCRPAALVALLLPWAAGPSPAAASDLPWPAYFSTSSNEPPAWARTVRRTHAEHAPEMYLKHGDVINTFGPTDRGRFVAELRRDQGAAWKEQVKSWARGVVAAERRTGHTFYWQLGNEISSPRHVAGWRAMVEGSEAEPTAIDRAASRTRRTREAGSQKEPGKSGRGGAPSEAVRNDPWLVPVYANLFLAPTIEALQEVRRETGAPVPVVLGSIGNGANAENRAWYAQLLRQEYDGRFAPSLRGRRVMDTVDFLAFHYMIEGANWRESLEEFRRWIGQGSIRGLLDTEEVGFQSTAAGTSGAVALRAFARYMHWWGQYGYTPAQVRVNFWNWDGSKGGGPGGRPAAGEATLPRRSMGVLHEFLGDRPVRALAAPRAEPGTAETYAYEAAGVRRRALFVLGPRGTMRGGAFAEEEGRADATTAVRVDRLGMAAEGWRDLVTGRAHVFSPARGHEQVAVRVIPEAGRYVAFLEQEVVLRDGAVLLFLLEQDPR